MRNSGHARGTSRRTVAARSNGFGMEVRTINVALLSASSALPNHIGTNSVGVIGSRIF